MTPMTDVQVRNKGFRILFRELGSIDTIRFLSQIPYEIRDYMTVQDELFNDLTVDELFERARQYQAQKVTLSKADQSQ